MRLSQSGLFVPQYTFPCFLKDLFLHFFLCFIIERDREGGMGDRGEDMQQMTTGRIQIRVAAVRTVPTWYAL